MSISDTKKKMMRRKEGGKEEGKRGFGIWDLGGKLEFGNVVDLEFGEISI